MPGTTYRYAVNNIMEALKLSFPDAEIQTNQVLFWVRTVENLIRKRHLKTTPTGAYLVSFSNVPVLLDGIRKYVVLPAPIYDMVMEGGVNYITYVRSDIIAFTQVQFQPTTQQESFRLYYSLYEKPSPSNPYFYRTKDRIYFLGVEGIKLKQVEMGLYAALDPRASVIDLDSEIGLNEEQLHQLNIEVLNMGRYVMLIPSDRTEEGADTRLQGRAERLRSTITSARQGQPPTEEEMETTPEE